MNVVLPHLRCTVVLTHQKWYFQYFEWPRRFRVRCLLCLFRERQGWKLIFERLQRRGDFFPENRIATLSNFAGEWPKDSRFFSYFSIENPSKRPGASPRRKTNQNPTPSERSKCMTRAVGIKCRLQTEYKMQARYKMQTADCRLGIKCRLAPKPSLLKTQ